MRNEWFLERIKFSGEQWEAYQSFPSEGEAIKALEKFKVALLMVAPGWEDYCGIRVAHYFGYFTRG